MTGEGDLRLIYVTAASKGEALTLARLLVEKRLVACANIVEGMTSVFFWQGKAQEEAECLLLAKTRADRLPAITEAIKAAHSYDVPCLTALPLASDEGNPDFLDWIRREAAPDQT